MMCPSRPADSPRPPGMGKGLPARCPWGEDLPPLGVGPSPCLSHCVRAVIHRARSLLGADSVSGHRGLLSPVWHGGEEGPWAPMGVSERPHTALRPGQAVVTKAHAARAPLHETWAGVVSRCPPGRPSPLCWGPRYGTSQGARRSAGQARPESAARGQGRAAAAPQNPGHPVSQRWAPSPLAVCCTGFGPKKEALLSRAWGPGPSSSPVSAELPSTLLWADPTPTPCSRPPPSRLLHTGASADLAPARHGPSCPMDDEADEPVLQLVPTPQMPGTAQLLILSLVRPLPGTVYSVGTRLSPAPST